MAECRGSQNKWRQSRLILAVTAAVKVAAPLYPLLDRFEEAIIGRVRGGDVLVLRHMSLSFLPFLSCLALPLQPSESGTLCNMKNALHALVNLSYSNGMSTMSRSTVGILHIAGRITDRPARDCARWRTVRQRAVARAWTAGHQRKAIAS